VGLMRCRMCRYMCEINEMWAVVYVGINETVRCVEICGELIRCILRRYICRINEMYAA